VAIDEQIDAALRSRSDEECIEWAHSGRPRHVEAGKWDKALFLHEQMEAYARNEKALRIVQKAFEESSPFRKVNRINRLFSEQNYGLRVAAAPHVVGGDETTPSHILYLVLARPKMMMTNWVYIKGFFRSQNKAYDQYFERGSLEFISALEGAVSFCTNKRPEDLLSADDIKEWTSSL
jgi:hypothetical protein